jgi:hypothetical protein
MLTKLDKKMSNNLKENQFLVAQLLALGLTSRLTREQGVSQHVLLINMW